MTSCRFPPVSVTASGVRDGRRSGGASSRGGHGRRTRGRREPPFEHPDVRPVHGAVIRVRQAGAAKLGQQSSVQARPHAGLGPIPASMRRVI